MKIWTMIAIVGLIPLGMAGVAVAESALASFQQVTEPCATYPLVPFTDFEKTLIHGSIVAHMENTGVPVTSRVCLFDEWGRKRVEIFVEMGQDERRTVEIATPPGAYVLRHEAFDGRSSATFRGWLNTRWCMTHVEAVRFSFGLGSNAGGGVYGGGCVHGTALLGVVGLVLSGGGFALGKIPGAGALLLYSRLAKPRLLDHAVRQQVVDLVTREPGIHSRDIVRGLDAADGQTAYHLGVLAREKLLVSIGAPGFRHWFVTGRFTPDQMRAIASLRDPTRRALYDAVVDAPGATLTDLTARVGVSLPAGSRAAKALERAGLIERRAEGRVLALRPLRAPADVFGATVSA